MELIIDANILISALINTEGKTYDLIFNDDITLFAPEFLIEEIRKYEEEILSKSGLKKEEFELFLSLVSSKIKFIPYSEFFSSIQESEKITPDVNDIEYFALASKFHCAIWSNDKKLKEQNQIKIYSTEELIKMIR